VTTEVIGRTGRRSDSPHVRNAVDLDSSRAVAGDTLDATPKFACAVITGSGVGFCSGMDLDTFAREGVPAPAGGDRGFAGPLIARHGSHSSPRWKDSRLPAA
jgi:enoyl-CoA hydratase/carnithine racemase